MKIKVNIVLLRILFKLFKKFSNYFFFIIFDLQSLSKRMNYYGAKSRININDRSNMHRAIAAFKQTDLQKQFIRNRLRKLALSCEKNDNKLKSMQTQIQRIQEIKQDFWKTKKQNMQFLRKEKLESNKKKQQYIIKREQHKKKLSTIKNELKRHKSQSRLLIRNESQNNSKKILRRKVNQLYENQTMCARIKRQKSSAMQKREDFLRSKLTSAKSKKSQQLKNIVALQQFNRKQIQQMKMLQNEILKKCQQSINSLNSSMRISQSSRLRY